MHECRLTRWISCGHLTRCPLGSCWCAGDIQGFTAKPRATADGQTNLLQWACSIPGKEGTAWAGAVYELTLEFTEDYPTRPPRCTFSGQKRPFHPNVCPSSGEAAMALLNEDEGWRQELTIAQVLRGIQDFLANPNSDDAAAAHAEAHQLHVLDRPAYWERVRQEAVGLSPR